MKTQCSGNGLVQPLQNLLKGHRDAVSAFTRVELVMVLAGLVLLALVITPGLASTKTDSDRVTCFNNLRLIGRAVQSWTGDHRQPPWWTPVSAGGTLTVPKPGQAWTEYEFLSNELVTPKILVCPADPSVHLAPTWVAFRSPGNRQNANSYSLWIHANADNPRGSLCSDRNTEFDGILGATCLSGAVGFALVKATPDSRLAWTNGVHGNSGHLLQMDGSVEFTSTARLRELVLIPQPDSIAGGSAHVLPPGR